MPDLWGKGHPGPANIPLPRYKRGDYPVAEGLCNRVLRLAGWIEAESGLIDQVAAGITRVVEQHGRLAAWFLER